jgi:hypothetical protein
VSPKLCLFDTKTLANKHEQIKETGQKMRLISLKAKPAETLPFLIKKLKKYQFSLR